jgi:hypothetical protein
MSLAEVGQMEYQIQANTRRCAVSGRELQAGEKFYSVLTEEHGKLVRLDYAADAWQGPPHGTFSFWSGRVPADEEQRRPRIDDELLADCFRRLEGTTEPGQLSFRYVVALLLMRRKRFRFEEARVEGGREIVCLRCNRTRTRHEVVNPRLTQEEMAAVQDEVFQVLGWEQT